ncbi:MAG: hypothetical protein VB858_12965 [Planctomycetaceae bacterium]
MAKNKQAKKKERERRVAQKKLAESARKRDQKTTHEGLPNSVPERTRLMTSGVPKADYVPATRKNSVTQRRSGG